MGHVRQEDVDLDDLLDRRASLLEDGLEVRAAQLGQVGDGALEKSAFRGEVDLARAVDGRRRLDGLRLGRAAVSSLC